MYSRLLPGIIGSSTLKHIMEAGYKKERQLLVAVYRQLRRLGGRGEPFRVGRRSEISLESLDPFEEAIERRPAP